MPRQPQAITWEPLPRAANHYMRLNVVHFEQLAGETSLPVAITVTAPLRASGSKQEVDIIWRLKFLAIEGFSMLPIDRVTGDTPWPAATDAYSKPALWEIVHSQWLERTVSTLASRPQSVHHYVIASSYELYQVAAQWWEVEELGEFDETYAALDLSHIRGQPAQP